MAIAKQTTATVIPALQYQDAPAAIDFLCKAFGFEKKAVYEGEGGSIAHAELTLGNGMVMLGSAKETDYGKLLVRPRQVGGVTMSTYCIVADPDAHFARAKAAGAEITREPVTQDYGGRDYTCKDPEGNVWTFGTYDPWVEFLAVGWAFPPGTSPYRRGNHIPKLGSPFQGRLTRWRSARIPTGPVRAGGAFQQGSAYPLHRDDAATVRHELAD